VRDSGRILDKARIRAGMTGFMFYHNAVIPACRESFFVGFTRKVTRKDSSILEYVEKHLDELRRMILSDGVW
jgi:hypothetical protein